MFMKTVSALAIATALGLAPVVAAQAQTSANGTPPATQEPSAQPTTPATPAQPNMDTTAPGTAGMQPDSTTSNTAEAPADTAGQRVVDGQITMQSEGTYLGTDLMNTTVYSSADETIGDVNDIIIGTNGQLEGVVVGVGGFLGIGEKQVALKLDQVKMMDQGNNTVKLVISSTKEQLENAPEFKTVAEVRQESDSSASTTASPGSSAPSSTSTPPATTTAPAD